MCQRAADDLRLLMDFLRHEMAVIALVDEKGRGLRLHLGATGGPPMRVEEICAVGPQHHPVAIVEIGDGAGERRQSQRVGAQIHLALAPADRQRCALTRANQQIGRAVEDERQRKGPAQARQGGRNGIARAMTFLHFVGDEMGDDFGVGLGLEDVAARGQFLAELAKVLDNAIMNHRDPVGRVRMRVVLGGPAMRRPAGVADANRALQGMFPKLRRQIFQLALGPHAGEVPVLERGDAR